MQIGEGVAPAVPAAAPPHSPGHLSVATRTVATDPSDRARTTVGVGERVKITASGATGALNWTITGQSTLSTAAGTRVTVTAADRAETTTVTVSDSCGCSESVELTVIEPDAVLMERAAGTNVWHDHGIPSVGIRTSIYIRPATVSFENIEISEDDCAGAVTGYFVGTPLDGVRHAGHGAGSWVGVGKCVAGKGSRVLGQDTAQSGHCNFGLPYSTGTFDWPIPWLFRVGSGSSRGFATVHQRFTIDGSGGMTVSKAGARGSARLNDPTSSY